MERDGITRVYITSARNDAWEAYPKNRPYEDRLTDDEALEVLSRVDFRCVNSESFGVNPDGSWGKKVIDEWGVYPKPEGKGFNVNRKGWKSQERMSKLAKILERKAGKKGLTIIVS